MTIYEILLIAISLGLDAFSVAVGVGFVWHGPRQFFRLSWHFGLFQALMPFFGWYLGRNLAHVIQDYSGIAACIILVGIGSHMIWCALKHEDENENENAADRTRGWSLILLSIATSIDAFGTGISLGLLVDRILYICLVIGITALIMTIMGMWIGKRLSHLINFRLEIIAGIILIILGIKMGLFS